MSAIIFDGKALAKTRELALAKQIEDEGLKLRLGSVVFSEDRASLMYTDLKKHAAVRVGIEFSEEEVLLAEPVEMIKQKVRMFCEREDINCVLIQKPMKQVWEEKHGKHAFDAFETWWQQIVESLDPNQDVDCLTRHNLGLVERGQWKILPATVKGVVTILYQALLELGEIPGKRASFELSGMRAVVLGRSDIVGKPLAAVLRAYGATVHLYGQDIDREIVREADIVVSATGKQDLVKAYFVREGAIVIDVGAPKRDVDFSLVKQKAAFITPVPGGVGPMTVVSLLENVVELSAGGSVR